MRMKFKSSVATLCLAVVSCISSYAAPICYDFNDNQTPPGTQLGDGLLGTARIQNGMLQINLANVNGDCGSFFIPDPAAGAPQSSLLATWRSYIGNGNAGADGYSLSWGANVNPGCVGEDGVGGSDLIVSIDTFDNGTRPNGTACDDCDEGNDYGIALDWRGTRIAFDKAGRTLATPGKGFLRKATFVDATVRVENNTATFTYDGLTISGAVDIDTTPVTGGNFMFGGRTGGANDNHWVDDLFINCFTTGAISVTDEPDDTAVIEGGRATFMAQVDGTPPYTFEWRSNGVVIASGTTYHRNRYITTPPSTAADDGDRYQLRASNANGSVTTREAVLDVQVNPRVLKVSAPAANQIVVAYSSPVQLDPGTYTFDGGSFGSTRAYGASHSEVVLTPDVDLVLNQVYSLEIRDVLGEGSNLPILPNPTTRTFRFGFGTPFCADFNDNQVPPGTQIMDGGLGTAAIADGVLKLNLDGVNSDCGGYFVPNQAGTAPLDFLAVTWKSLIGGINDPGESLQFGHGADGYSFSWGSGVTATCVGEAGMGNDLIVSVDTFDNGGAEVDSTPGVEVRWRGTRVAARLPVPGNKQASKDFMRKGRFVDVGLIVKDGNVTLNYDGIVIGGPLPGFGEGVANANFLFGGRTGGANDNQWIDDLKINCFTPGPAIVVQDPQDTTVRDGDTASFSVQVDGTPPYSFQWYKNNQPIAGATSSTYITPPTTGADEGAQFHVVVSNEAGSDTSAAATLHVNIVPRVIRVFSRGVNRVHVLYTSPVQLDSGNYVFNGGEFGSTREYGATHSEVVLVTDIELVEGLSYTLEISDVLSESSNLALDPNPTTVQFGHGFGTPICFDFNDNQTPPGTTLSDGALNTARIENGILHLTDAQNSDCGSIFIPNQAGAAPLSFLVATWLSYIGDGVAGADGYSFNWGSDVSAGCAGAVEDGTTGTGLVVGVDTFDNGTGDVATDAATDYGIEIKWRGQRIAYDKAGRNLANPGKQFLRKSRFVPAALSVDNGVATFEYDGIVISGNLPNFGAGIVNGNFLLAARTGGANDNQWIDDLRINCFAREGLILVDDIEDAAVLEGQTATFTAEVDGFPPYNYQWTRNGAVIASGVTYNRVIALTTPPTGEADDGARYQLQVSNSGGSVTTREAVLDVLLNPRVVEVFSRGSNELHVIYHRPVVLNSGTYTVFGAGTPLLCSDFNADDGGFTVETPIPYDGPWVYNNATGTWQQDGQAGENSHPNTSMLNSPSLTISAAGVAKLSFVHRHSFEGGFWDGGQVRVSVNGGPFTTVPGSSFTMNGYNGTVLGNSASVLAGQPAYVEDSAGRAAGSYITSEASLGTFSVGDVIQVQFIAASDTNTKGNHSPNWEIDSVCIREGGAFGVTARAYGATHNEVILTTAVNLVLGENYTLQIADVVGEGTGDIILPNPTLANFRHGFRFSTQNLFIEAEDFNTVDSSGTPGHYIPSNPATGESFNKKGLYNTLGARPTIDYNDAGDGQESNLYRTEGINNIPHVNMVCTEGGARPGFELVCDYKIGWTSSGVDWYNYTRTFPPGEYTVWARLSHGEANRTMGGDLSEVTSDRTVAGQTTVPLGSFRAPSTVNWDGFAFVPLRDASGNLATVSLRGERTLRYSVAADGGDFNYLMLVFQAPLNQAPVCAAALAPEECVVNGNSVVALDNQQACITLDGTGSSDPDGDALTYSWTIIGDAGTNTASGATADVCLDVGCYTIVLAVSDGFDTAHCQMEVCVIGAGEALESCITTIDDWDLGRKNKRPLIASLKAAQASFDRGDLIPARNQLRAFLNKVRAQVADPAAAAAFTECVEDILEAIDCAALIGLGQQ